MKKIAVILYGPPGGGKGTQANLLATQLQLIHFETGKFCEQVVHDPKRQKEKIIRRERKLFDAGILMTPSFVLREVARRTKEIAKVGWGVVYSGSPRTIYEAEGLVPILEKLYGKKNIFVFGLKVKAADSMKRNSNRMLCSICRAPLLTAYYPSKNPKHCPVCAGPLYKRTLDKPEVIKVRLKEYEERTFPIFAFMRKRGYRIVSFEGNLPPYRIFQKIHGHIKNSLGN
ncbi:MAG: nucleoside monophosphate kinase [Patescibacteria group bacterium]|mgnify:CR=1 FL=1